jgi:hypothetical protein
MNNNIKIPTFGIIATRRPQGSSSMKCQLQVTLCTCGNNLLEIHNDLAHCCCTINHRTHPFECVWKAEGNSTELNSTEGPMPSNDAFVTEAD